VCLRRSASRIRPPVVMAHHHRMNCAFGNRSSVTLTSGLRQKQQASASTDAPKSILPDISKRPAPVWAEVGVIETDRLRGPGGR
jgi:hypothetical protein